MLANAIANYLDNLGEREFDSPFMALLRAHGYYDIHFLHGSFEFGKDFIAKRNEEGIEFQYCFQTKAGDIALTDWHSCRGQLDLLRTNALAHPSFNRMLPRKGVFVITGRLLGGAPLAAQDYAEHLRALSEIALYVWDRESLIERIAPKLEITLGENAPGAILKLLGEIDLGRVDQLRIEQFSVSWCASPEKLFEACILAALIANKLRIQRRLDLSCIIACCLIRAAWLASHGNEDIAGTSLFAADSGRELFRFYAGELADGLRKYGIEASHRLTNILTLEINQR